MKIYGKIPASRAYWYILLFQAGLLISAVLNCYAEGPNWPWVFAIGTVSFFIGQHLSDAVWHPIADEQSAMIDRLFVQIDRRQEIILQQQEELEEARTEAKAYRYN